MAVGLELRSPYLDKDLIEFAFKKYQQIKKSPIQIQELFKEIGKTEATKKALNTIENKGFQFL